MCVCSSVCLSICVSVHLCVCAAGTSDQSSFDCLTISSCLSCFKRAAHFCLSRFKLDETSETRMAQSCKILGSSHLISQDSCLSHLISPVFSRFKQASTVFHVFFQNNETRMAKICSTACACCAAENVEFLLKGWSNFDKIFRAHWTGVCLILGG